MECCGIRYGTASADVVCFEKTDVLCTDKKGRMISDTMKQCRNVRTAAENRSEPRWIITVFRRNGREHRHDYSDADALTDDDVVVVVSDAVVKS